jgi:NTE family protein
VQKWPTAITKAKQRCYHTVTKKEGSTIDVFLYFCIVKQDGLMVKKYDENVVSKMKPLFVFLLLFIMKTTPIFSQENKISAAQPAKIGICLSGGGALGIAHIGALQALEEFGIVPNCVAGTSMGSIVGVLYAAGYSPAEILQIIEKEKVYKFNYLFKWDATLKTGLSKQTKLRKILNQYIPYNTFDSLKKFYAVCCTDIKNAKARIFSSGNHLKDYVIASSSIPCIFESVVIEGIEYVDGGVINNFPIEALKEASCDMIIGVGVVNFTPYTQMATKMELLPLLFAITDENTNKERYRQSDHFIAVKGMNTIDNHIFSFKNWKYIYQCGYESMRDYLSEHPEIK